MRKIDGSILFLVHLQIQDFRNGKEFTLTISIYVYPLIIILNS